MKYIAVDDEESALRDLETVLKTVEPDCELVTFTRPGRALAYAEENTVDIAFLDVEMGSANGLVLAKKIKDVQPSVHIIFVTGFEQYALGAIRLHATGYLLKPATVGDLQRELTFLYGEPLVFGRSKAKELLAYLIDRKGSTVTIAEACAALWEDTAIASVSINHAAVRLNIDKPQPQGFADFRRLAAKKALASSRSSFSSFRRWIFFACSLFCCLSFCTTSVRLIALSVVCAPGPRSSLASLARLFQP